jgi:DnaJ-class molecular chaperone
MQSPKDYYHILGVDQTAASEDIKRAYRKLAVKYHPDHNPGDKAAEERFKLISEAYAVLMDQNKRSEYDRARRHGFQRRPGAAAGGASARPGQGFSYSQEDIFREFFAGAYARQAFSDLAREFKRNGFQFDEKFLNQVFFGGRGFYFKGFFFTGGGPGRGSAGRFRSEEGPEVKTSFSGPRPNKQAPPQGRKPAVEGGLFSKIGKKIKRLTGSLTRKAAAKALGGPDINFNLNLTPAQAVNGAEVKLVYRRGGLPQEVTVKVPPGVRNGAKLRLKEMGETMSSGRRGDLFIHVKVP